MNKRIKKIRENTKKIKISTKKRKWFLIRLIEKESGRLLFKIGGVNISINNITLVGKLVRDPELTYIQGSGTAVAKFTIAVNRDYKDKEGNYPTDFIPVEVMGKSAEYVSNYITKGRLVGVVGSVRVERYEKDGEKKTFTKVQARNVQGLESAKNADVGATPVGFSAVEDDDVPF